MKIALLYCYINIKLVLKELFETKIKTSQDKEVHLCFKHIDRRMCLSVSLFPLTPAYVEV